MTIALKLMFQVSKYSARFHQVSKKRKLESEIAKKESELTQLKSLSIVVITMSLLLVSVSINYELHQLGSSL